MKTYRILEKTGSTILAIVLTLTVCANDLGAQRDSRVSPSPQQRGKPEKWIKVFDFETEKYDLVTVRDKAPYLGHVVSLAGSFLRLKMPNNQLQNIKQEELIAIFFSVGRVGDIDPPPPTVEAGKDLIFLRSGGVKAAKVLGIQKDGIFTSSGRFERDKVYLILFQPQHPTGPVVAGEVPERPVAVKEVPESPDHESDDNPPKRSEGSDLSRSESMKSDVHERCTAECIEHFKRVQAYAQKIAAQQKAIRSAGFYLQQIALESFSMPENYSPLEVYKRLLAQQGQAYSEEEYQNYRRSMYSFALSRCIRKYFDITNFWIDRDLDYGSDLSFWASVMAIPLETFAGEQHLDATLGTVTFNGIAIPPYDDLIINDNKSRNEFDREKRACLTSACYDRAKAKYCKRWLRMYNVYVQETMRRFNFAAENFEHVAMELVRTSVKRILDAREFELRYRYNDAKQTWKGWNDSYGLLAGKDYDGDHVLDYLDEQEKAFESLRRGREMNFEWQVDQSSCDFCGGETVQARLPTLRLDKLDELLAEIRKIMKPDLDAPVNVSDTAGSPSTEKEQQPEEEDCTYFSTVTEEGYDKKIEQTFNKLDSLFNEQFQPHFQGTLDNIEAWRTGMATCGIAKVVSTALGAFLAEQGLIFKAILQLKGVIEKLSAGDPSWLIPNGSWAMAGFTVLTGLRDALQAQMGGDAALRNRLRSCSGTMTAKVYGASWDFLNHRAEVHRVAKKLAILLTQLQRLDTERWVALQKPYRKCTACAEEQGKDPSLCPPPFMGSLKRGGPAVLRK